MSPLEEAKGLLARARAPLMLIGAGARRALPAVERLRRRLRAPILTTPEAKSLVDERQPESGGVFSIGANPRAQELVARADLIVAIGTELGEFASRSGRAFEGKAVIQVIDDAREIATTLRPDAVIVDELATVATALAVLLGPGTDAPGWFESVRAQSPIHHCGARTRSSGTIDAAEAAAEVAGSLPAHARIACDVTSATLLFLRDASLCPGQRLWCNLEKSACMGGALPAGIGLSLASGLPTIALIGDWGLLMGSSELHTLASLRLPSFVVLVWSNGGGALIRSGVKAQRLEVADELHSWRVPVHFARLARSYGLEGVTVRTAPGLRRTLRRALRAPHPTLIEAKIDPLADIPAGDRYLHLDASSEQV